MVGVICFYGFDRLAIHDQGLVAADHANGDMALATERLHLRNALDTGDTEDEDSHCQSGLWRAVCRMMNGSSIIIVLLLYLAIFIISAPALIFLWPNYEIWAVCQDSVEMRPVCIDPAS